MSSPTPETVRGTLPTLRSRRLPLADATTQIRRLEGVAGVRDFEAALREAELWPLKPLEIEILQVNVGKICNQTCRHCHVDAGPDRKEVMTRETLSSCLEVLAKTGIPTVDITGGAPEMNPHFRWFVSECRKLGKHVMDRCNLTILSTGPHRDLPEFFAAHQVEVICSLPHYRALGTDRQRGRGVHDASIEGLKRLNALGYGDGESGLRLVLVTNPVGALLPTNQKSLEREWQRELFRLHGIRFDALYTITNMPISRYLEWLEDSGNLEAYLQRLARAFNPAAARAVMCRSTLSVGWDGTLYDCDFNQMLELSLEAPAPRHISEFDRERLNARALRVGRHCFGCTAGQGSSCGGSTAG